MFRLSSQPWQPTSSYMQWISQVECDLWRACSAIGLMKLTRYLAWLCVGFWMDVGQPPDYLSGMCLYLKSLKKKKRETDPSTSTEIIEPVLIVGRPSLHVLGSVWGGRQGMTRPAHTVFSVPVRIPRPRLMKAAELGPMLSLAKTALLAMVWHQHSR